MPRHVRAPRLVVLCLAVLVATTLKSGPAGASGGGASAPQQAKTVLGYFRQPAIWNETLVFTAEGDLWRVPLAGGVPERLTSHPGQETNAVISADGSTVVFSGTYEGPRELYQLPLTGGAPRRLTWIGGSADGRGLDARGATALHDRSKLDAAERSALHARHDDARARRGAAVAGERRDLRGRRHAVLHAAAVSGQPHAPLSGRHRAEDLEVCARRERGRARDGRLRWHEQGADGLAEPRLLSQRPRRHDEPLVDGPRWDRRQTAHASRRLRRPVAVAVRGTDRLSAWRGHPALRDRQPAPTGPYRSRWSRTSTRCANDGSRRRSTGSRRPISPRTAIAWS